MLGESRLKSSAVMMYHIENNKTIHVLLHPETDLFAAYKIKQHDKYYDLDLCLYVAVKKYYDGIRTRN
jgi:hypothetical protein